MSVDDMLVGSTFNQVLLVIVSTNANLSNLTTSDGTLTPSFNSNTVSYAVSVSNSVSSITVTPTAADALATIQVRVNGGSYTTVLTGIPSGSLPLNVGANTVDVKVTAEEIGTVKTYTLNVNRASGAPAPEPITYTSSGGQLVLNWTNSLWSLYTGTNVTGVTNLVPGATSPYTNSVTEPQRYYRLVYP
jgi:hypothetical protein